MQRWWERFWDIILKPQREAQERFMVQLEEDFEQSRAEWAAIDAALMRTIDRMRANLAELARLEEENKGGQ